MDHLVLPPIHRLIGEIRPPGSKSIANRILPLAALARGTTRLQHLPDGEDVSLMRDALTQLGIRMVEENQSLEVSGMGHAFESIDETENALFLGNSGTATRILTALLTASRGKYHIDGIARMRERPIGDMVNALTKLIGPYSTSIEYLGQNGYLPLRIQTQGLQGGHTKIRGDLSSQFTTGLLMALPLCQGSVTLEIEGKLVSAPYVDLTLSVMRKFGALIEQHGTQRYCMTAPQGYFSPGNFSVEPDASSASYFLAAGAIAGGPITVLGLNKSSPQGEIGFVEVLKNMGAKVEYHEQGITVSKGPDGLHGIDQDMDLMSDTGMTLAVTALFAKGPTMIRNVGNWRLKETDRLKAMSIELRKTGAQIMEGPDSITISPPSEIQSAEIETYNDHRMAMCFALASLGKNTIMIRDPQCVRKTYPGFFADFQKLIFS